MNSRKTRRNVAAAAALLVVLSLQSGAWADITNLCPDGTAPSVADVAMTTDPLKLYLPADDGLYRLGRVEEGDTKATGTLMCEDPQSLGLGMRVRVYMILPTGPNWASCLGVVETPLLGALGAPACATLDQANLGTITKFPWRGAPSQGNSILASPSANTGNQQVLGCATCGALDPGPSKVLQKLAVTSNGNVALAVSLAYGTIASNLAQQGIYLPAGTLSIPTAISNLIGPVTVPGIYHVETAFGQSPAFSCGTLTPAFCATARTAFDNGAGCPTTNAACTALGIAPAFGVCPLTATQCAQVPNTAARWFSDDWVQGKLYGEWIVTGIHCVPNPDDQDPSNGSEAAMPLLCDDPQPIAISGCDGTQTTEDGCLTKLLPTAPDATPTVTPTATSTVTPTPTGGTPTPTRTPTRTPTIPLGATFTPVPTTPTPTPTPCLGTLIPVPYIGPICISGVPLGVPTPLALPTGLPTPPALPTLPALP